MNRRLAEAYANRCQEFDEWFNKMTELTMGSESKEEAQRLRRALAEMLIILDEGLRRPLSKEYPDLFPDQ